MGPTLWLRDYLELYSFISKRLESFLLSLIFSLIPTWSKYTFCVIFILLNLLSFVFWPWLWSKCSIGAWKEYVFCCWVEFPISVNQILSVNGVVHFFHILVSSSFSCCQFLKSPTIMVELSILPFRYISFPSCILKLCCLVHTHLKWLCLPGGLTPLLHNDLRLLNLNTCKLIFCVSFWNVFFSANIASLKV